MYSKSAIYRQAVEFNRKTFQAKLKKRRELARLPFEEKLNIVAELNSLRLNPRKKTG